jgi:hypothetical protein
MIYDGTGKPEQLGFTVDELVTSLEYTFKLFSMNRIFTSTLSSDLTIKIGLAPSQPGQPVHKHELGQTGEITIEWSEPTEPSGWEILTYELWISNELLVFPTEPIVVNAS